MILVSVMLELNYLSEWYAGAQIILVSVMLELSYLSECYAGAQIIFAGT